MSKKYELTDNTITHKGAYLNCGGPVIPALFQKLERQKRAVEDELSIYAGYEANWDGYGANEFSPKVLDMARRFLDQALVCFTNHQVGPDNIIPGPASDGTVEIEFFLGARLVSLIFDEESSLTIYQVEGGRTVNERCHRSSREFFVERAFGWLCGS
jgi:hypothetical protein